MSADMKELRGLASAHLVQALDAFALAEGKDRTAYVNEVLMKHVVTETERINLILKMSDGNPLLPHDSRSSKE